MHSHSALRKLCGQCYSGSYFVKTNSAQSSKPDPLPSLVSRLWLARTGDHTWGHPSSQSAGWSIKHVFANLGRPDSDTELKTRVHKRHSRQMWLTKDKGGHSTQCTNYQPIAGRGAETPSKQRKQNRPVGGDAGRFDAGARSLEMRRRAQLQAVAFHNSRFVPLEIPHV
jgi:hypothetical protein